MMLGMMKELFSIAQVRDDEEELPNTKCMCIVEEEVPVSQGPSIVVPLKGRGCHVTVDDNVPALPLVNSLPFRFSQKCKRFFLPFFLINAVDL
jgi:hypothetical protein